MLYYSLHLEEGGGGSAGFKDPPLEVGRVHATLFITCAEGYCRGVLNTHGHHLCGFGVWLQRG